jgi:sugar lactone lactonase YvrE
LEGFGDRARVDREWTADDLRDGPLTVTWEGHLWSYGLPGRAIFIANAPGPVAIEVDGQRTESLTGGFNSPETVLPLGEHNVRVTALIAQPGRVAFDVHGDVSSVVGADALYTPSVGERGFRVLYRLGAEFTGTPTMIGRVPYAVPADARTTSRALEYQGVLDVRDGGNYGFALDSGNSAQLFVDDQLVVDNGGAHPPRRVEGFVNLAPGEHTVSIQYTIADRPIWSLYLKPPLEGDWSRASGAEFRPPEGEFRPTAIITLKPDEDWGASGREIAGVPGIQALALRPDGGLVVASRDQVAFVSAEGRTERTVPLSTDISDIDVADSGEVVVLDRDGRSLVVLGPDGNELRRVTDGLGVPTGVDVVDDRIYVASPAGGAVYSLPLTGGEIELLAAQRPVVADRALQPSDVAVAADGTFFIADFDARAIVVSPDGVTARRFPGVAGSGTHTPRLATYGAYVIVADTADQRIVIYERDGRQRGVYVFPPRVEGTRPLGIAATSDGVVYAADIISGRVYRFTLVMPEGADDLPQ